MCASISHMVARFNFHHIQNFSDNEYNKSQMYMNFQEHPDLLVSKWLAMSLQFNISDRKKYISIVFQSQVANRVSGFYKGMV